MLWAQPRARRLQIVMASASVDFPLPRGPMMQVRPRGILTLKPGRNPPLISIFSTTHMRQVPGINLEVATYIESFHRAALETGLPTCRA